MSAFLWLPVVDPVEVCELYREEYPSERAALDEVPKCLCSTFKWKCLSEGIPQWVLSMEEGRARSAGASGGRIGRGDAARLSPPYRTFPPSPCNPQPQHPTLS